MVRGVIRWLLWKMQGQSFAGDVARVAFQDTRSYAEHSDVRARARYQDNRAFVEYQDSRAL